MDFKDPFVFFSFLIITNSVAYGLNVGVSLLWNKAYKHSTVISKKEILFSLFILLINILIAIPGFILWTKGVIIFSDLSVWLSFISLFLLMDFLMYILHWVSHNSPSFKKIHAKHHEHTETFNCVSLYYMSPWESIFFGILLTIVVMIFPLNIGGFLLFLILNWFYGVITHLNVTVDNPYFLIFTTNAFHKKHHQLNYKNFGFYTFLWDKIFKTEAHN